MNVNIWVFAWVKEIPLQCEYPRMQTTDGCVCFFVSLCTSGVQSPKDSPNSCHRVSTPSSKAQEHQKQFGQRHVAIGQARQICKDRSPSRGLRATFVQLLAFTSGKKHTGSCVSSFLNETNGGVEIDDFGELALEQAIYEGKQTHADDDTHLWRWFKVCVWDIFGLIFIRTSMASDEKNCQTVWSWKLASTAQKKQILHFLRSKCHVNNNPVKNVKNHNKTEDLSVCFGGDRW